MKSSRLPHSGHTSSVAIDGEGVTKYYSEWRSVVFLTTHSLDVHLEIAAATAVILMLPCFQKQLLPAKDVLCENDLYFKIRVFSI